MQLIDKESEKKKMNEGLAYYAVSQDRSRGRRYREESHPYRTEFERDRDRVIHCSAFRRLEGKTQVFTPGLDDFYRSRLTHSIEVSQIGRTIAKSLKLNEVLTEAICLAHDLGHPPFGHEGQRVLNDLMSDFRGFEHNRQSLRVVDFLEHPYRQFEGLNLMYETRLGLAKHSTPYDVPEAEDFSEANCSLEGQVADIADRIAVSSHDLEDGMRGRLIERQQLREIELFKEAQRRIEASSIDDMVVRRTRTAKAIIDKLVSDCIEASKKAIFEAGVKDLREVYDRSESLIVLSQKSQSELVELEEFLGHNLYHHESLEKIFENVRDVLGILFEDLRKRPRQMPGYFQHLCEREGLETTVCDYIAGMTDRFCLKMVDNLDGGGSIKF